MLPEWSQLSKGYFQYTQSLIVIMHLSKLILTALNHMTGVKLTLQETWTTAIPSDITTGRNIDLLGGDSDIES